jgi:hypothetical protein
VVVSPYYILQYTVPLLVSPVYSSVYPAFTQLLPKLLWNQQLEQMSEGRYQQKSATRGLWDTTFTIAKGTKK